jgi:hypothetical protein
MSESMVIRQLITDYLFIGKAYTREPGFNLGGRNE